MHVPPLSVRLGWGDLRPYGQMEGRPGVGLVSERMAEWEEPENWEARRAQLFRCVSRLGTVINVTTVASAVTVCGPGPDGPRLKPPASCASENGFPLFFD
jgi:hypothetical protein